MTSVYIRSQKTFNKTITNGNFPTWAQFVHCSSDLVRSINKTLFYQVFLQIQVLTFCYFTATNTLGGILCEMKGKWDMVQLLMFSQNNEIKKVHWLYPPIFEGLQRSSSHNNNQSSALSGCLVSKRYALLYCRNSWLYTAVDWKKASLSNPRNNPKHMA